MMQTQTSQTPTEAEYARCALEAAESRMDVRGLNLWYGDFQALKGIDLSIPKNRCTAFIGPSGCGKSTLLRTFNRMCDFVPSVRHEGRVELDGIDVFDMDACALRIHVGMVFQHPNPFPMSIRDNVLYGPSRMGKLSRDEADEILERCLTRAALWGEAKDKLDQSGLGLSGGQQQRLCIARALAVEPDVLLMDEPTSALDPGSTMRIEELMSELKEKYTVVIVTHNMQQAARISDETAFFLLGEMIEKGPTEEIFSRPKDKRTEDYITGRFG